MIEAILAGALGAAVGLVMGLTGAGGTIIAVPLLVWGLGWSLPQAAPVALLAIAVGAGIGTVRGLRERLVRWRAALLIGAAGLALAPLGLWLSGRLPHEALMGLFAAVLFWVAGRNLLSAWRGWRDPIALPDAEVLPAVCPVHPETGRFHWTIRTGAIMGGIGAGAGLLSGLLGVGGGFVVLPALLRVSRLSFSMCVGTTLMVLAVISGGTVLMALLAGREFSWLAATPFVLGVTVGLLAGQRLAPQLPLQIAQAVFALLAAGIGAQLGWEALAEVLNP
jgi:uncharacterized protein